MDLTGLLGIFCGIGVALGAFLFYLMAFGKKDYRLAYALMGMFFLAIALRVGKSIGFFILYDVAPIGLAFGYLGLSTIGPLLLLSLKYCADPKRSWQHRDFAHFLLPLVGIIVSLFYSLDLTTRFYQATTLVLLGYVIYTGIPVFRNRENFSANGWPLRIWIGAFVVVSAFIYQHASGSMAAYAYGAAIAALPMFYLLAYYVAHPVVLTKASKKEVGKGVIKVVKAGLEQEKLFLNRNISIARLAEALDVPAYQVSKAVKDAYGRSFPETVNAFRIEEAKQRLINSGEEFIKVEGLAYDVGFNTTSAFYSAFKKETGMSPKEYQKNHSLSAVAS